jgi:hypothetical protein
LPPAKRVAFADQPARMRIGETTREKRMHRKTAAVTCVALACAGSAHAVEIHKCTDADGRITFSQQRCEGTEVSTIDLEMLPSTGAGRPAIGSSPDYQAVTQRVADRLTNRKIQNAENRVETLTRERDEKLLEYREEMMRTGNYVAGVDRAQQYHQLITSTRAAYDSRIADKQAEIAALREQLHVPAEQPQPE